MLIDSVEQLYAFVGTNSVSGILKGTIVMNWKLDKLFHQLEIKSG